MKKLLLPIITLAGCVGTLSAATSLTFTDLNAALTGNSLQVDGGTAGLTVSGAASGDNYLYSVTYTGADYNDDMINDTLTFGVLVQGWKNGTIAYGTTGNNSDSSATIGTTSTQVILGPGNTWNPSNSGRFELTESLQFSLTSFNVLLSGIDSANAVSTGFTQVFMDENAGSGHRTIFGEGTGLDGNTYNANLDKTLSASYGTGDLFVSTVSGGTSGLQYGAKNVDFGISVSVIPEPSSSALLLGSFGLLLMRRRRSA